MDHVADTDKGRISPEVILLTGMSGAGRSTAANALEDMDWYVVDNLPPQMIGPLVDLVDRADGAVPRLAVVADVRSRSRLSRLDTILREYGEQGIAIRIVFLDASDEVLVQRFESVRRPHPLQDDGTLIDGIEAEREALSDLRDAADLVIDTSDLNVHQLKAEVLSELGNGDADALRLTITSFGFKHGLPKDADHVADVRFLPNPHWDPELKPKTGQTREVRDYVFGVGSEEPSLAESFLDRYTEALLVAIEGYQSEHRSYAMVAIGCTGGKHRSVAIAEELSTRLAARTDARINVKHRDLGRE